MSEARSQRGGSGGRSAPGQVIGWRAICAALLLVAAIGAIVQSANASDVGRIGAFGAVLLMAGVAYGVLRGQTWAFGSAFLLGICWFWAAVALTAQGSFSAFELVVWLAWSIVVIVASVRMRASS